MNAWLGGARAACAAWVGRGVAAHREMVMRGHHAELYVHFVWTTWDRVPVLTPPIRERLYACMRIECERLGVAVLALGGIEDHVHLLARLPTTRSASDVMQHVKGVSSHLATHELAAQEPFNWQGGYCAISVSPRHVPKVLEYVEHQEQRHRDGRLSTELETVEDTS